VCIVGLRTSRLGRLSASLGGKLHGPFLGLPQLADDRFTVFGRTV
jgi:hypothetical protein